MTALSSLAPGAGGEAFSPMIVEHFTGLDSTSTYLDVYFTISTWRPYYVVLMKTQFTVTWG